MKLIRNRKRKGKLLLLPIPLFAMLFFPSVTTIINSNDSSTVLVTKKKEAAAASSETFQRGSNETVAAASNRARGLFSRPRAEPKDEPKIPFVCKHVFDFYNDCFHRCNYHGNTCQGYAKLIKECQQMGSTSTNISNVSNPTLSVPSALILMSYEGCMAKHDLNSSPCKKYKDYFSETFKDSI